MKCVKIAAVMFSALIPLAAMNAPAIASTLTFDWTLSGTTPQNGGFPLQGSGTLTATTTSTPGEDLITAISGTLTGGVTITEIANTGTLENNDNLLFPTSNPLLDGKGLAFDISTEQQLISSATGRQVIITRS
jgi:hypothetical protein